MTLSVPTALLSASNATDLTVYTTASTTIQPKATVVVFVVTGKSGGLAQSPTGVTHSGGLTVTKIGEQAVPNANLVLSYWSYSNSTAAAIAGTLTITHGVIMENCAWHLIHNQSDLGAPTIRQFASSASAAAGTEGPTVASNCLTASTLLGAIGYNSGSANTPTVGTGFTAIGTRQTVTSPTIQLMSEYDNASAPRTASFTVPIASGRAQAAIEVADGTAPVVTSPFYMWNGATQVPATVTMWNGSAELPVTL